MVETPPQVNASWNDILIPVVNINLLNVVSAFGIAWFLFNNFHPQRSKAMHTHTTSPRQTYSAPSEPQVNAQQAAAIRKKLKLFLHHGQIHNFIDLHT